MSDSSGDEDHEHAGDKKAKTHHINDLLTRLAEADSRSLMVVDMAKKFSAQETRALAKHFQVKQSENGRHRRAAQVFCDVFQKFKANAPHPVRLSLYSFAPSF